MNLSLLLKSEKILPLVSALEQVRFLTEESVLLPARLLLKEKSKVRPGPRP